MRNYDDDFQEFSDNEIREMEFQEEAEIACGLRPSPWEEAFFGD